MAGKKYNIQIMYHRKPYNLLTNVFPINLIAKLKLKRKTL